jgi:hypothetical protein
VGREVEEGEVGMGEVSRVTKKTKATSTRHVYLEQWVSMLQKPSGNCMPCLMVGHRLLLIRLKNLSLLFETGNDSLDRLFIVFHLDGDVQITRCDQRCLVAHVSNVGSYSGVRNNIVRLTTSTGYLPKSGDRPKYLLTHDGQGRPLKCNVTLAYVHLLFTVNNQESCYVSFLVTAYFLQKMQKQFLHSS